MLHTQSHEAQPVTTQADAADSKTRRIRDLNDAFRKNPFCGRGRLMITPGVADLPDADRREALERVFTFDDFSEANDPHGEHDFGAFDVKGHKIFWKIDYYAHDMEHGSPDPSDPDATCRVLTVLLASEY